MIHVRGIDRRLKTGLTEDETKARGFVDDVKKQNVITLFIFIRCSSNVWSFYIRSIL